MRSKTKEYSASAGRIAGAVHASKPDAQSKFINQKVDHQDNPGNHF